MFQYVFIHCKIFIKVSNALMIGSCFFNYCLSCVWKFSTIVKPTCMWICLATRKLSSWGNLFYLRKSPESTSYGIKNFLPMLVFPHLSWRHRREFILFHMAAIYMIENIVSLLTWLFFSLNLPKYCSLPQDIGSLSSSESTVKLYASLLEYNAQN